jgi:hypothetical protein
MRRIIAVLANVALFSTLLAVGSTPLNAAPIVKSAKIIINFSNNSSALPFDAFDKIADAADAIRADSGELARVGLVAYKRQSGETTAQKNLTVKRLNAVKKDIRDFQPVVTFKTDKIGTYSKVTAPQRNRIIVYMNWNLPAPVIASVSAFFTRASINCWVISCAFSVSVCVFSSICSASFSALSKLSLWIVFNNVPTTSGLLANKP